MPEHTDDTPTTDDRTIEQLRESLFHPPDEIVTERLELPSALWNRLALEKPDGISVGEYLVRLASTGGPLIGRNNQQIRDIEVDVEIEPKQWELLRFEALSRMQTSENDLETAYWDVVDEHVHTTPNLIVDGEPVGPEDLIPDECDDVGG